MPQHRRLDILRCPVTTMQTGKPQHRPHQGIADRPEHLSDHVEQPTTPEPTLLSPTRSVHRRIEGFVSVGVAARRVLPGALSWSNKSSIIGSCHEPSSVCSGTPIRAGASPAEPVAGQYRAPGEQSTQPLRRCCDALVARSQQGRPTAHIQHLLRNSLTPLGVRLPSGETAPARHRHRRRSPGHTVVSHAIPDHLSSASRHIRRRSLNDPLATSSASQVNRRATPTMCESLAVTSASGQARV
jgi:hypothetical protein